MERTTIDLWFGAFVTAGFVALLVLALKVGNLGAERATETYRVEARFDNIGGLKVRGPVRSAGVLVGRVAEIHFDNDSFQARVTPALAAAQETPDQLVKRTTDEVLAIIKADKDLQSGNMSKVVALAEQKVLPHFDFTRMARLAVGRNWAQANDAQKESLTNEFRT